MFIKEALIRLIIKEVIKESSRAVSPGEWRTNLERFFKKFFTVEAIVTKKNIKFTDFVDEKKFRAQELTQEEDKKAQDEMLEEIKNNLSFKISFNPVFKETEEWFDAEDKIVSTINNEFYEHAESQTFIGRNNNYFPSKDFIIPISYEESEWKIKPTKDLLKFFNFNVYGMFDEGIEILTIRIKHNLLLTVQAAINNVIESMGIDIEGLIELFS